MPSTPAVAGNFSAVAYFFARRLQHDLQVPVGVVVSAVGATAISEWQSRDSLAKDAICLSAVDKLRIELGEVVDDHAFARPGYDDAAWAQMPTPAAWEKAGLGLDNFDGVIWLRKTVTVQRWWHSSKCMPSRW